MSTTREEAITRVVSDAKANPKGGEAKALLEVLGPDEIPERAVKGLLGRGSGLLIATDRRAIFVDKGLIGLRVEEFPYQKISSIQYKTGMMLGEIIIHTAGNEAIIENVDKKVTRDFGEWLRTRITRATSTPAPAAPVSNDPMAQLEQLGKLREAGVVTEEEFAAKKKQLLGL